MDKQDELYNNVITAFSTKIVYENACANLDQKNPVMNVAQFAKTVEEISELFVKSIIEVTTDIDDSISCINPEEIKMAIQLKRDGKLH